MRGQDRARDGQLRRLRPRRAGRAPGSPGDGDRGAGAAHASGGSLAGAEKAEVSPVAGRATRAGLSVVEAPPGERPASWETVQEKGAPATIGRLRSELVSAAGRGPGADTPQDDCPQMAPEVSEKIENAPSENLSLEETAPELNLAGAPQGEDAEASPEIVGPDWRLASSGPFDPGVPDERAAARPQMAPQSPEIVESAPDNDTAPGFARLRKRRGPRPGRSRPTSLTLRRIRMSSRLSSRSEPYGNPGRVPAGQDVDGAQRDDGVRLRRPARRFTPASRRLAHNQHLPSTVVSSARP